jgi:hypothetical protein
MGCIYNGVCSSLVALFLRQQVTNLAAVTAHCGISPSRYWSLLKSYCEICVSNMVIHLAGSAAQFPHHFVDSVHIAFFSRTRTAYGSLSQ